MDPRALAVLGGLDPALLVRADAPVGAGGGLATGDSRLPTLELRRFV